MPTRKNSMHIPHKVNTASTQWEQEQQRLARAHGPPGGPRASCRLVKGSNSSEAIRRLPAFKLEEKTGRGGLCALLRDIRCYPKPRAGVKHSVPPPPTEQRTNGEVVWVAEQFQVDCLCIIIYMLTMREAQPFGCSRVANPSSAANLNESSRARVSPDRSCATCCLCVQGAKMRCSILVYNTVYLSADHRPSCQEARLKRFDKNLPLPPDLVRLLALPRARA